MKKIKIAQVITRMDWGGAPDIVRILCEHLEKDSYDIKLITGPSKHISAKTRKFLEKFVNNTIVVSQLRRDINPVLDLIALFRLYFLFRSEKFDVVHTHTAKAGILGRAAAHLAGVPKIIHTSHGHNFYGYFGPLLSKMIVLLERLAAQVTGRIVPLTELERDDLIRFKVTDDSKITVVHTAIELDGYRRLDSVEREDRKRQLGVSVNDLLIGMVGRLEPIKGPHYFIEAACILNKKFDKLKFIVVGEGSLRKDLERRAEEANSQDKFIFTGWRDDVLEIIFALDILVLPSLNEAIGLVLIEAQGLGVPVVATRVGGVPEVVEDGKTGILVDPRDSKELAKAIEWLVLDKDRRKEMGVLAEKSVEGKYSVQDLVKRITQIYEELIREKNKGNFRLQTVTNGH